MTPMHAPAVRMVLNTEVWVLCRILHIVGYVHMHAHSACTQCTHMHATHKHRAWVAVSRVRYHTSGHVAVTARRTTTVQVSRKPHAAWAAVVVSMAVTQKTLSANRHSSSGIQQQLHLPSSQQMLHGLVSTEHSEVPGPLTNMNPVRHGNWSIQNCSEPGEIWGLVSLQSFLENWTKLQSHRILTYGPPPHLSTDSVKRMTQCAPTCQIGLLLCCWEAHGSRGMTRLSSHQHHVCRRNPGASRAFHCAVGGTLPGWWPHGCTHHPGHHHASVGNCLCTSIWKEISNGHFEILPYSEQSDTA